MTIIYSCAKCGEDLVVHEKDAKIYRINRKHETEQDFEVMDNDCPNCGYSNFLKIFVEVD